MELGDIFEYDEETGMYVAKHKEEFYKVGNTEVDEVTSSYNAEFKISPDYAKSLLKEGFLEECENVDKSSFVNIFDEINTLLNKYTNELKTLENDMAGLPACVKVERETVLTNLITLLNHLKSLKK